MTVHWDAAGATDRGLVRRGNEDAFRLEPAAGLFLVADGMGGHAAGEIASAIAVDTVHDHLLRAIGEAGTTLEEAIRHAFQEAHRRIVAHSKRDRRTAGMGTTLTAAVLSTSGHLYHGHLGDSRLYHLQGGNLYQLTRDHTWVQQEVDAGRVLADAARTHALAHVLTRVLSGDEPADPDVARSHVVPGDTLLLCSDGLHNLVDGQSLLDLLIADSPPAEIAESLIRTANRRGGTDNITAIVVKVLHPS